MAFQLSTGDRPTECPGESAGPAPLALTMGEPGGIGGEILLQAWSRRQPDGPVFFAIDDPARLQRLARALRLPVPIATIVAPGEAARLIDDALPVFPLGIEVAGSPGRADPASARAVIASIERAVALALAGEAGGVVTNPIQKGSLQAAGFGFPGHTEFLADLTGATRPVMMLVGGGLRVVPVTIHEPLRRVPDLLTTGLVLETACVVDAALRQDFAIPRPRLVLAGLNPHAGEGGVLGLEDERVVAPAVAELRRRGIDARGPLPADTLFHAGARRGYDAALCMYHDQAMLPVKTLAFDEGVNATLGLPVVRTSPDHGTALDIAGKGVARPDSLIAAIALADAMARRRTAAREREAAA